MRRKPDQADVRVKDYPHEAITTTEFLVICDGPTQQFERTFGTLAAANEYARATVDGGTSSMSAVYKVQRTSQRVIYLAR